MRWNMRMKAAERGIWKSTSYDGSSPKPDSRSVPGRCGFSLDGNPDLDPA